MRNEFLLLNFTASLSELMERGMSVRAAVREIASTGGREKKVQALCGEIGTGLEEGRTLSSVLASCLTLPFPRWYTAFVGAAEAKDCMGETFAFLAETVGRRQKSFKAFLSALIYPAVVTALCFLASLWAVCMHPAYFANDSPAYEKGACASFLLSGLFMLCVAFLSVLSVKLVTRQNPCLALMHVLAFLTRKGTSLRESLECAIPVVEKNGRLCDAVLAIREDLLRGQSVAKAFSESLEDAGFSSAARLLSSNVAFMEAGGGNAFERTAMALAKKAESVRASVLSCEQPVLLCCAAVYMLLLLKDTLMPYLIGGGMGI